MADSVYRVTEVVGVSSDSWEQATKNAVEKVSETVRDLRIAEVVRQDVTIDAGKVVRVPHPARGLVQVRQGVAARSPGAAGQAAVLGSHPQCGEFRVLRRTVRH